MYIFICIYNGLMFQVSSECRIWLHSKPGYIYIIHQSNESSKQKKG